VHIKRWSFQLPNNVGGILAVFRIATKCANSSDIVWKLRSKWCEERKRRSFFIPKMATRMLTVHFHCFLLPSCSYCFLQLIWFFKTIKQQIGKWPKNWEICLLKEPK